MDNKSLALNYYTDMKDAPVSDLFRQDIIKTENQLMVLYDSCLKNGPETGINAGAYIIFYQGGLIGHGAHVPVLVAQSGSESEYNES